MIAAPLLRYLEDHHTRYHVHTHEPRSTASEIAHATHVPGRCFAKSVLLHVHDRPPGRMILAVVPADREVDLSRLHAQLGFPVALADESSMQLVFPGYDPGTLPPIGELAVQQVPVFVDTELSKATGIAFNGGTSTEIVEMPWTEYARITKHTLVDCGCAPDDPERTSRTTG